MSVVLRGAKNVLRNPVRTGSIVLLLGAATAFAFSLLLANQAVNHKLKELKQSGATTLSIMPSGSAVGPGALGGGEPLTNDMFEKVKGLAHVSDSGATLGGGLRIARMAAPAGDASGVASFSAPESEIDLESPIDAGTLGRREVAASPDSQEIPNFKLPVQATGVSGNLDMGGEYYSLSDGAWFSSDDSYQAVVGKDLATHNNLKIGSTFTAYDQIFTVVGIYDAGDTFRNANIVMPLKTFQDLTERANEVSSIFVKVNSIENIDAVEAAIKSALGSRVEITSSAQNTKDALESLKSIQRISVAGVIIAIVAAATIVFLVMVMIVRERKKEIAVLKAIGGSNLRITGQFVTEAIVLTILSVIVGSLIALGSGNTITKLLVTSSKTETSSQSQNLGPNFNTAGGGRVMRIGGPQSEEETSTKDLLADVKTNVGPGFLIQGFAAVILISVLGSALPAFAISKIRPAEVMRGEQ